MTRSSTAQAPRRSSVAVRPRPEPAPDQPDLEDAVARVRELSLRLWAVREEHPAVRGLLGRTRCRTCGDPHPCRTVRATGH